MRRAVHREIHPALVIAGRRSFLLVTDPRLGETATPTAQV
jgi:hypothetical protein